MRGRAVVAIAVAGLLAGCGANPTPPPPTPAPGPASAPATPAASPEDTACAGRADSASTVRGIAAALEKGPVLPAGVALFLLDARRKASAPGITDPALAAAQAELVAAIDDLDAQGWAGLPEGGNPAQDLVALDATRIVAAVDAIERVCAARE